MSKGLWLNNNTYVNIEDKQNIYNEIATRANSPDFFSQMFGYLPNPDTVLKKQGKDISIYREIEVDAKVSAVIGQRKSAITELDWSIERGQASSAITKEIKALFDDLDVDTIISEIFDAVSFGYQPLEVIWQKVGSRIFPASITGKPQEWFVFGNNNMLRLRTRANMNEGEPVPDYKFLLARYQPRYNNPYGVAQLSKCFWPVAFKRGGMKFWITFIEKYGMPWIIGKQPRGTSPENTRALRNKLSDMLQDAVGIIPNDSSVEVLEAAGKSASSDLYTALLRFCNDEIALAYISQTLTTEMGAVGSRAASETHSDQLSIVSSSDKKFVVKVFKQLLKWINYFNYNTSVMPEFKIHNKANTNKPTAERDEILSRTGVKFTKSYYQNKYNFLDTDIEIAPTTASAAPSENLPVPGKKEETKEDKAEKEGVKKKGAKKDDADEEDTKKEKSEFAEETKNLPEVISEITDKSIDEKLLPAAKILQLQIEQTLKPVFDLINSAAEFSEIENKLVELYPQMNTEQIQNTLTKLFFIAEVIGRLEEN